MGLSTLSLGGGGAIAANIGSGHGSSFGARPSARGRISKVLEKFALHCMSDRFQAVMGVKFLINVM